MLTLTGNDGKVGDISQNRGCNTICQSEKSLTIRLSGKVEVAHGLSFQVPGLAILYVQPAVRYLHGCSPRPMRSRISVWKSGGPNACQSSAIR